MNCFEARQEFRALWRKELGAQARTALLQHLKECPSCTDAFRVFALSAPVLHSRTEPESAATASRERREAAASARHGGVYRGNARARAWLSMSAALTMFIIGAMAAYLSVSTQVESLNAALSQPELFVETLGGEAQASGNDFAG